MWIMAIAICEFSVSTLKGPVGRMWEGQTERQAVGDRLWRGGTGCWVRRQRRRQPTSSPEHSCLGLCEAASSPGLGLSGSPILARLFSCFCAVL